MRFSWPAGRRQVEALARDTAGLRERLDTSEAEQRALREELAALREEGDRTREAIAALARLAEGLAEGGDARQAALEQQVEALRSMIGRIEVRQSVERADMETLVGALAERVEIARRAVTNATAAG